MAPTKQAAIQREAIERAQDTWNFAIKALSGEAISPGEGTEAKPDRRFAAPDWTQFPFNVYARGHKNVEGMLNDAVTDVGGVTEYHEKLLEFAVRMLLDGTSPSNFLASNPELLALTRNEEGQNLVRGLENFVEDLRRTVNGEAPAGTEDYELGKNLAITPGKVVFWQKADRTDPVRAHHATGRRRAAARGAGLDRRNHPILDLSPRTPWSSTWWTRAIPYSWSLEEPRRERSRCRHGRLRPEGIHGRARCGHDHRPETKGPRRRLLHRRHTLLSIGAATLAPTAATSSPR
ncbi:MAG: hypothetical protein R3E48_16530 [Burkholderiaceae bacterium]